MSEDFDLQAFAAQGRAFLRIGNYEFEIVVPPILAESAGPEVAAQRMAELIIEQIRLAT